MGYDEMSRETRPCNCGKGTIVSVSLMNDFFQCSDRTEIHCDPCQAAENEKNKRLAEEREARWTLRKKALALAKERFLEKWLHRFFGLKGKRAWEALPRECKRSLGTFYRDIKGWNGGLEGYLVWQFEQNLEYIIPSFFPDKEIEGLIKAAKEPSPTRLAC